MGHLRDYNPKMEAEWHRVSLPMREEDKTLAPNSWGRMTTSYEPYKARKGEAVDWCGGPMVHGRFAVMDKYSYSGTFYFKSKKDAMIFKLTWGGE